MEDTLSRVKPLPTLGGQTAEIRKERGKKENKGGQQKAPQASKASKPVQKKEGLLDLRV